jgi:dihydrofolate reductase
MRKLICYIACSVDGYIAGPSGEIDWLYTDQDYGYTEFVSSIDTVVMGRKTYDLCLSFEEYPYQGLRGFVFSRIARDPDDHVIFVSTDIADFMTELKDSPGRNIWLVGGGQLLAEAVTYDLLDELILSIHPIILGEGVPLFSRGLPTRRLRTIRAEQFSSGLVQIWYERHTPGCDGPEAA